MSSNIAEAITNAQTRREAIYTKLNKLGATMPTTKNLTNLPSTIDTVFKVPWVPMNYIESTGTTQYIDTGIVPSNNTDMEIKIRKTSNVSYAHPIYNCNSSQRYGFLNANGTFRFDYGTTMTSTSTAFSDNTDYIIKINNGSFIVNGTTLATKTATFNCGYSLTLFRPRYDGSASVNTGWVFKGRIYYLKIFNNDKIERNFIPCKLMKAITASQDSQGVARAIGTVGLWDVVNDKFYGNAGTGSITAG